MVAVTICSDFGAQDKSVTVSIVSLSICHEVMRPDAMILVFWMLSFNPAFSLSSYTFMRLFSSSSLSAIRVVSFAYLRLLIFLLATLIPTCASFSSAFHMTYSAYKLNKQGDNIQPWRTPFPVWNQSVVPCLVLTVASWPAYRLLRRQVRCMPVDKQYISLITTWHCYVPDFETDLHFVCDCFFRNKVVIKFAWLAVLVCCSMIVVYHSGLLALLKNECLLY